MSVKDKFVSALAARTGLTKIQAELAVVETVGLIKTKVPSHIGLALDQILDSDNGVAPSVFFVVVEKAVPAVAAYVAPEVRSLHPAAPSISISPIQVILNKIGAFFKSPK